MAPRQIAEFLLAEKMAYFCGINYLRKYKFAEKLI
jgi:hypothetical protein